MYNPTCSWKILIFLEEKICTIIYCNNRERNFKTEIVYNVLYYIYYNIKTHCIFDICSVLVERFKNSRVFLFIWNRYI